MNIVLEGPDNGGKSTLADAIAKVTGRIIVRGKGPCTPQNVGHRFMEFDGVDNIIFDRHACVSEPIYGPICRGVNKIDYDALTRRFYATKPLFVYCRGISLVGHVEDHAADTPDHLQRISTHYYELCSAYDKWAMRHAHIVYRKGEMDMHYTVSLINSVLHYGHLSRRAG